MNFLDLPLSPTEIKLGCLALVAAGVFAFILIQPYLRRIGK